jgi:type IV pilus biogenesis protein PilP
VVDPAAIEEAVTAAQPPANPTAPATGEVLSPEAAEASYAATGIWQRAPDPMADPDTARADVPTPAALGDISATREVAALPAAGMRGAESLPPNTMPPPPPGTSFTLGEGGLVVATPEGTLAPSGILVHAGRPAKTPPPRPLEAGLPRAEGVPRVKPPPRPANLVIPAEPFLPDPPVVAPDAVPDVAPDTVPEVAPEDGAALDGPAQTPLPDAAQARAELAAVVPPARPDDLIVATSNAPDGGLIDAAVDDVIDAAFADASEYAVARSIPPQHRPDNFAAIVDSVREAMSDGSRVAAAPAAPAAATAAPVIPASADVAARATVENALNLRDVNLIGIYGGSNSRRALVRLENGRYVKVKVGDRLEGGQVTSITASQLTYQKGRNVYALEVLPLG